MVSASLAIAILGGTLVVGAAKNPHTGKTILERPPLKVGPLGTGKPFPESPAREAGRYCFVKPSCAKDRDDAAKILKAFHDCNNGGTVVLDSDYLIGSPLDLTFLEHVDVAISGTIKFSDDIDYWVPRTFKYPFQDSSSMWRFGGKDVNIYGGGVGLIDGNGQAWYDRFALEPTLPRPISIVTDGLEGGSITGLRMINPPNWFNLIANSSDIIISDFDLSVATTSKNPAKNTDGWDTFRADNIVIQNSNIDNGDDCVSFKPNSTNVLVQGLACNGSHGISVGSLGQYVDGFDIVENIYVYNISMSNAGDGARIKVWPGIQTPFQPALNGGGGSGYVRNVTYDYYGNKNNDWVIELTQCYGSKNQTLCNMYPANLTISDVVFKNFYGTSSKKYDPKAGTLVCSAPEKCNNIRAENIKITTPSGVSPKWICNNMQNDLLDLDCVSS